MGKGQHRGERERRAGAKLAPRRHRACPTAGSPPALFTGNKIANPEGPRVLSLRRVTRNQDGAAERLPPARTAERETSQAREGAPAGKTTGGRAARGAGLTLSHRDCSSSCPPRSQNMSRACPTSTVPTAERAAGEAAALRPHRAPECSRTTGPAACRPHTTSGVCPPKPTALGDSLTV